MECVPRTKSAQSLSLASEVNSGKGAFGMSAALAGEIRLTRPANNREKRTRSSFVRHNVKYTDRVRLHPNLARSRAKSGTRRCWCGPSRQPAARAIADRFLA